MTARWFTDDDACSGPPVTPEQIAVVEAETGFRLPRSYLALLEERNGGELVRDAFMTDYRSSWGGDHFRLGVLCGIGPGSDGCSVLDSAEMIAEWELPVTGLLISSTPSGHDWVLLDYAACGPQGEPSVVHVDEDLEDPSSYVAHTVAPDFAAFLAALVSEPATEDGGS